MSEAVTLKTEAYRAIEEKYSCSHDVQELRKREIKNGAISYVKQCVRCGNTSTPIKKVIALHQACANEIKEYDYVMAERWRAAKSHEYQHCYKELAPLLKTEYEKYLKSEKWQSKRLQVIAREEDTCEICAEFPVEEVHHLTYVRLGNENLEDLMGLCFICHKIIHNKLCT